MNINQLPSVEYLKECFDIDPQSPSFLRWKKDRPRSHFKSDGDFKSWTLSFAGKNAGYKDRYYIVEVATVKYRAHKIIYAIHNNTCDFKNKSIDHIDGNRYNNDPNNLRLLETWENLQNRKNKSKNKNGTSNIYKKGNKFYCMFNINKKRYYLGMYSSIEEAVQARDKKGQLLNDKFSRV